MERNFTKGSTPLCITTQLCNDMLKLSPRNGNRPNSNEKPSFLGDAVWGRASTHVNRQSSPIVAVRLAPSNHMEIVFLYSYNSQCYGGPVILLSTDEFTSQNLGYASPNSIDYIVA